MKTPPVVRIIATGMALAFQGCANEDLEKAETCFDHIKNQDELGVDCGGQCEKICPSKMSAKVNGGSWVASSENISSGYTSGSSTLKITGSPASGIYPRIQLVYVGPLSLGSHALDPTTSYLVNLTSFIVFDSGTITFSTVDTRNRVLDGTFSFACSDTSSGTTYNITDGLFEMMLY